MMSIAPAHLAMALAIDAIAVLPTIRAMIAAIGSRTTRQVEQTHDHTHA
jgi:hypothetical protein